MSDKIPVGTAPSPRRKKNVLPAEIDTQLQSRDRRRFLGRGMATAGSLLASSAVGATAATAAPLPVPATNQSMGKPIPPNEYGTPSKFEKHVVRRRTDVLKNLQNWSDWSMTPLQYQPGIITPNGLIFERHHGGTPDIDPAKHRFVIHGLVKQPLTFTMDDLVRYPSVSRFHFHECSGNGLTDWLKPASKTVQQTHGLLSGVLWTGVPASTLLEEAGIDPRGKWVLFEGADGSAHTRSIPIEKVLDDVIIAYGMNGERLRPENGYPVRAVIPGWEGNVSVKWLRRIKVGEQPWHFRSETARYTDPMPEGKWRQFSMVMECKSVITSPSGGQQLNGPGFYEVTGLAWSGAGKIRAVDVSFDGGRNWREAMLEEPIMDKCLTRFKIAWNWDGAPAVLMSRAVDSTGYVQPSVQEIRKVRAIVGFVQHHNAIQPWSVNAKGEVSNVIGQA
ncbi:MAG: sulfite dehydrogenase [Betaproteobacteria bacterium]|nr:sulfite dehydrogenase [Betaproteobacteria bacterium]